MENEGKPQKDLAYRSKNYWDQQGFISGLREGWFIVVRGSKQRIFGKGLMCAHKAFIRSCGLEWLSVPVISWKQGVDLASSQFPSLSHGVSLEPVKACLSLTAWGFQVERAMFVCLWHSAPIPGGTARLWERAGPDGRGSSLCQGTTGLSSSFASPQFTWTDPQGTREHFFSSTWCSFCTLLMVLPQEQEAVFIPCFRINIKYICYSHCFAIEMLLQSLAGLFLLNPQNFSLLWSWWKKNWKGRQRIEPDI